MKFTPGPWTAHKREVYLVANRYDLTDPICETNEFFDGQEAAEANAKLIAAAPGLYRVLENIGEALSREASNLSLSGDTSRWLDSLATKAHAALAAAEGK